MSEIRRNGFLPHGVMLHPFRADLGTDVAELTFRGAGYAVQGSFVGQPSDERRQVLNELIGQALRRDLYRVSRLGHFSGHLDALVLG